MMLSSTIDAMTWFYHRSNDSYQPINQGKLHALLYLSQGYYGAISDGEKLLPSIFIATSNGPIEPNIKKAWEHFSSPPAIFEIPESVVLFINGIWRKYQDVSGKDLFAEIKQQQPYINALQKGENSEILFSDMVTFFKQKMPETLKAKKQQEQQEASKKPVFMPNENGRAVKVSTWQPKRIS